MFSSCSFTLNLYKSKVSRKDTHEKENKSKNKTDIWKLSLAKVKETKPSWKPWPYIEKIG